MLTQEGLKELFDYDPETGALLRRISVGKGNRWRKGTIAGHISKQGYGRVRVEGRMYLIHRLVWLWHKGYLPENDIDHIDRDKTNNRIENLREVSKSCNLQNTGNPANNTSGVKGISWWKSKEKWRVRMYIHKKDNFIKYCVDFDEAVLHRLAAEQCVGSISCNSSSPAYKYAKENGLII